MKINYLFCGWYKSVGKAQTFKLPTCDPGSRSIWHPEWCGWSQFIIDYFLVLYSLKFVMNAGLKKQLYDQNILSASLCTWRSIFIKFGSPRSQKKLFSVIENGFLVRILIHTWETPLNWKRYGEQEWAWTEVVLSFKFLYSSAGWLKSVFVCPQKKWVVNWERDLQVTALNHQFTHWW